MRRLVISDIHGCYIEFRALLGQVSYNPAEDQLILIGDYIDRGPYSRQVLDFLIELSENPNVVMLRGNHDQMMIDAFTSHNEDALWLNNGGHMTIISYTGDSFFEEGFDWDDYMKAKNLILNRYASHIAFLETLPFSYHDDEYIYVHAGINPCYEDWTLTLNHEMIWIRDMFYRNATNLEQIVVFGHTPTSSLHEGHDIWFQSDKIGIDGACAYGGQLNCLIINEDGSLDSSSIQRHGVT
jgi:serine/threonine protein phosphatase 1